MLSKEFRENFNWNTQSWKRRYGAKSFMEGTQGRNTQILNYSLGFCDPSAIPDWQGRNVFLRHCNIHTFADGVTRVGVTRGGNSGCHPYLFPPPPEKLATRGCHPAPFLPVRPSLSTVLCKSSHNFFLSGVIPWRVSPGAVRPWWRHCTFVHIWPWSLTFDLENLSINFDAHDECVWQWQVEINPLSKEIASCEC